MHKQNRLTTIIWLIVFIIFLLTIGCSNHKKTIESIDAKIQRLITDITVANYSKLSFEKETKIITAVSKDGNKVSFDLRDYDLQNDIINIYLVSDNVRFVVRAWIDDESGIVYSKDNQIDMNGIMQLERIGGTTYYYSTTIGDLQD